MNTGGSVFQGYSLLPMRCLGRVVLGGEWCVCVKNGETLRKCFQGYSLLHCYAQWDVCGVIQAILCNAWELAPLRYVYGSLACTIYSHLGMHIIKGLKFLWVVVCLLVMLETLTRTRREVFTGSHIFPRRKCSYFKGSVYLVAMLVGNDCVQISPKLLI